MVCFLFLFAGVVGAGFDEFGYNRTTRNFVGTGSQWCLSKFLPENCLGIYSPDKLVMKWNAEWGRGNAEGWTDPNGYVVMVFGDSLQS